LDFDVEEFVEFMDFDVEEDFNNRYHCGGEALCPSVSSYRGGVLIEKLYTKELDNCGRIPEFHARGGKTWSYQHRGLV